MILWLQADHVLLREYVLFLIAVVYFKYIYSWCFKSRDNMQRHLSPLHETPKSKEKKKKNDIKKKSTKGDDKKKENQWVSVYQVV